MKKSVLKIITMIVLFTLILSMSGNIFAGRYDNVFEGIVFTELAVYTGDEIGSYQMRGFTATADGKYLFGGCLQSDKRVYKFDAATGEVLGEYKDSEPGYAKGLSTDDRGYLYVGISNQANDGAVLYSIVDYETMKEVYIEEIAISGKVGINGACVAKIGEKYYLYFVTNYGPNYIYCYDVTDVNKPVINKSFANNGIMTISDLCGAGSEGSYLGVDESGIIYISCNTGSGSKGDTLFKISADGKSVLSKTSISEAYGVSVKDDYVIVSTYGGADSCVYILNTSDLSQVAKIGTMGDATNYSMAIIGGDKLYIADHGYGGSGDRILVSSKLNIPEIAVEIAEEPTTRDSPKVNSIPSAETASAPVTQTVTSAQTSDSLLISATIFMGIVVVFTVAKRAKAKK